jgi:Na+/H+ antiporter NhaC
VRTQLPYSLVVAAIALVLAYVPSSFGLSPRWSLTVAALAIVGVLLLGSRWKKAATPGM